MDGFQSKFTLYSWLNIKKVLAPSRDEIRCLRECNCTRTQNHLAGKRTLNHLVNWPNHWSFFLAIICRVHLAACSCHVTYAFQSESTLYSWLNVKELLAPSRHEIWSWSDCNCTRTQNHLSGKRTLNHLVQLPEWLKFFLSSYLYGAIDCMLLWCHIRILEGIDTLQFPECEGNPCWRQAQYLKFKWLQLDSNHLARKGTLNHFAKLAKWLKVFLSSYLWIWLYVLVMPNTRFRVHQRSIVAWISTNSFLQAGVKSVV